MTNDSGGSAAAAVALTRELLALFQLKHWIPMSQKADAVLAALGGGEGLDAREVNEIRLAADTWGKLDPQLRRFYAENAPGDSPIGAILFHLLFKRTPRADIDYLWKATKTWEEVYGATPNMDLYPEVWRRR